ncbi:hypothetical protein ASPZODRAFT_166022 [Penicilliopsis zonata CBS 506.65]|uniref:Actin cytoskeleton-regulatory complex protein END3 n=1 Tax=Penicilliopsis zonata CBS 506.65 TaxID=1073090 RepID=A0A1L9SLE6_9EURO|nr:hypothetical protein ASPZODRAFT_166022 [Penicilliopsis zonata CBS 506.65]OJJ47946.1 hypothetical protein ASPZODRAFT_166022 [Penicilliopsis zonata CBS 506.65]
MASATQHPNLNLTAEEKRVFYQLFQAADTTNLGVITGEIAVPFFEKTKLPPETLGLIWQIADRENRGLLTPSGFSVVLRLIGHAQAGRPPTEQLALQSGPLPRFDGVLVDATPAAPSSRASEGATSPPPPPAGSVRVPPLNPDDVNKFSSLFDKSDIKNGLISGEIAKQIFERARLPNEILGRIWYLADTKQRGALDATEFIIAMHLLTAYKSGAMRGIPQILPPGLYDAATRRGNLRSSVGSRSGLDVPPVPAIPKQFTGPTPQRTQSPISRQPFTSPLSAQSTGGGDFWLITPQEKAQFDTIFATVDTAKAGMINGEQAVGFFMNAQLPEETLAQIWDLADIDADGQLTRDEFAVAMYLVRQQRTGKEPLPQAIPSALVPPSMRRQTLAQRAVPAPAAAAPAPVPAPAAAPPPPRSAAEDLFGLDAFTAPAPAPAAPSQIPQSTGGSNTPFQVPSSPTSRVSPQAVSTTFKPFVPSSSFGQSLQPQFTGVSSVASPLQARSPPLPSDDLLGDNDPEESNKLTQETTELANLSNQIGSLAKEMQNVQEKRTSVEQNLSQTSQQKRDFEMRLAQARAMYEQEVKSFKVLEEQLNASRAETTKLQSEYALIDGSRHDLQTQYNQVAAALAADQQENASLKEKISLVNAQVAQLKPALEKARSEARQQKGLVAINKKQLSTQEAERDKVQGQIDELARPAPAETEEAAVASPVNLASPAASTTSQNTNPFFRRAPTASSENVVSPDTAASADQQRTFDSLFGPSFGSPSTATPPPPTSFRAESPLAQRPVTSGAPSPSVSPPPPPLSRQATPGFLPFGEQQSATSSTQVSPPASRFGGGGGGGGGADTSGFGTPMQASTINLESQSLPAAAASAAATSPFDELLQDDATMRFPEVPGGFPESGTPPPITTTQAAPAPALSTQATGDQQVEKKDLSFDELFGGPARQRSQSQQANDFHEAFAVMKHNTGPSSQPNGTMATTAAAAVNGGDTEFPPIQELDDGLDADDDSSDSDTHLGFDDDFAPTSPPRDEDGAKVNSLDLSQLNAFPAPGTSLPLTSPTKTPPAPDAQPSPPNYDQSVSAQQPGDFPPEFTGLLPSRADPTAAPDAPHSVDSTTGVPVVGGEPQHNETSTKANAAAPDFDAAFAGLDLAPAKEAEDDEDEEEEEDDDEDAQYTKNTSDFDFTFDSPSQPKPVTASTAASDFFAFDQTVVPSASTAAADPSTAASKPAAHDWDALFAPLETANGAAQPEASEQGDSKVPGWALAADPGEDDMILQKLTGMGFSRDDAVAALEKFDYNIDKASKP